MKPVGALVLASLAACSADSDGSSEPITDYTLTKVRAIAGEHRVVGLDSDGSGGLWLAYQARTDVYAYDDLQLVHLDHAGDTLAELHFTEDDLPVCGIAYSGDALWVNYNVGGDNPRNRVRKLDPITGAELAVLPTEGGLQDIAMRDGLILLSSTWRELVAIATTGVEQWRVALPELEASESRGVTSVSSGTWVVSLTEARAVRVDDTGAAAERAAFPFAADDWSIDDGLHLATDGVHLILHRRNQITWYAQPE